jgi:uncharacterized protein (TIGR00375 family)
MQIIADLQLHSKYSRATSRDMDIEHLAKGAKMKGLNLIGTGDFTHPLWLEGLKEKLRPIESSGIFEAFDMNWMLTAEISTVYEQEKKIRKVHHLFYAPNFDIIEQINDSLKKYGDLESDGRPTLKLTSPEFVEIMMSISKEILILPSHAWTPWFSVFGSKSGFNSLKECYQDQVKHIFALETGLSSDPPMNWRLSELDNVTLMSNSDSHSPNPWRLGREANVFELKKFTYKEIFDAVKNKDKEKFLFTVETDPNYGKYHYDGHRNCEINLSPEESKKFNGICPKCGRNLTIGVLHRVEELADRPEGFVPKDVIPFKSLLPLYEIISFALGIEQLYSQKVIKEQNKLIENFGNEFNVLLNISKQDLVKVTDAKIADAIIKVREGRVKFIPGYDGVYGRPVFSGQVPKRKPIEQKSLKDY